MSAVFARAATEFWRTSLLGGDVLFGDDRFVVATDVGLSSDRRLMVLTPADGATTAVLTPALADRLGLGPAGMTEADFRGRLAATGLALHDPDRLFYLQDADKQGLLDEEPAPGVRRLTQDDADLFAAFQAAASADDLDAAYVELDHWAVFGAVEDGRLVCAASAYPWGGGPLADIGVLTLPPFRGRRHGRGVVRSLSRYICRQGYEPQYRCQLDNSASVALAGASGLSPFGTWELVSSDVPA